MAKAMAEMMIELGISAPSVVGFKLIDESGEVIAEGISSAAMDAKNTLLIIKS